MQSGTTPGKVNLSRAWYPDTISGLLQKDPNAILGELARCSEFAVVETQSRAWLQQIDFLKNQLAGLSGSIYLEFKIPRMGRRIDAVLVIGSVVFVVEFKVGQKEFDPAAVEQVWDYALDLKNFHKASHSVPIIPVLISTEATHSAAITLKADLDRVFRPICVHPGAFREAIDTALRCVSGVEIAAAEWAAAPYQPTPTIIEAARTLYAQHSVEDIARHDAGAENLALTSCRLEELVDEAKSRNRKVICFVTGVPGAGKTLVGLNIATQRRETGAPTHAVFLSGNGPLVAVLREALTRDEVIRRRKLGENVGKGKAGESVKAFIQNVHHFRDEALIHPAPPADHVVIFDEAQRAWNRRKAADFMLRKKKRPGFDQSEPEFLISYMDRHQDWASVICLVGGGQEIHIGEAGIDAWLKAINARFPHWQMHISSRLTDTEYAAGKALDTIHGRANATFDDCLHLSVSMRSFRAENVSAFIKVLLDCERGEARRAFAQISAQYPIFVTRNLQAAKNWVRNRARGSERFGLVASSKAQRLKPHAVDIRVNVDPVQWFLNERDDTRSSYYLEDAATEFQVQGLELDWTCVTWDGDLRFAGASWSYHDFRGSKWTNVRNEENRRYLKNAYRVLLTRARQGMVIFVPPGDNSDPTRSHAYYDPTFAYLRDVGIPVAG